MATRAEPMEGFIVRLEKQIWATWLPVVASAALALGFMLGSWFANARQAPCETTNAGPPAGGADDRGSRRAQKEALNVVLSNVKCYFIFLTCDIFNEDWRLCCLTRLGTSLLW